MIMHIKEGGTMYAYLSALLADKKGGNIFTCFGGWHWFYILLTIVVAACVIIFLKNKPQSAKNKGINIFIYIAFGLYVADFFLMPFAYGEIDIEKLPFHICTITCVLCFVSRQNRWLSTYRAHIALLAFISNLMKAKFSSKKCQNVKRKSL